MTKPTQGTNFSFDVGMTSLGIAVNKNGEIEHADVLLMHEDAGAVNDQARRRRQFRTREAHKAREGALESLWQSIGKQPLQRKRFNKTKNAKGKREFSKTKADARLEREFPKIGDNTVYASSLLRIMLLEGEPLEDWQIYKALHAAIQRRGYDEQVPWKNREQDAETSKKDKNPGEQVKHFKKQLRDMTADEQYHLPCYYDAWKMGLWDSQSKEIIAIRQPRRTEKDRARGYNASRELVTKEITTLLECAAEKIPELKAHLSKDQLNQLLYGEQGNAVHPQYPSYSQVDGLLGQKYPRFENRIVAKCALMPRLNVCRSAKPLVIEVGFLMRLVNWRYECEDEQGTKSVKSLDSTQIGTEFSKCEAAWKKKSREYDAEEYAKCFKLTKSKLAKLAEQLDGSLKPGHEKIEASKHTGRSRFSQPALYLMKQLILSDKTPDTFHDELSQKLATLQAKKPNAEFGYPLFPDTSYQYFAEDLECLNKMGDSRESIHMPAISLAERYLDENNNVETAILKVINSCNWPQLRHRLHVFHHELENLTEKFGKPDAVHIEFIREDFLGDNKKREYTKQANAGRQERDDAKSALKERRIAVNEKNILRYRLFVEQNEQCVYTGKSLDCTRLESYDIDHIFPDKDGGPDSQYNFVLTRSETNQKKGKRLPCECDFIDWSSFKTRVNGLPLGKNKKKILLASTRQETEELIDKYTGLAGTAHIARLARDIACLKFGWQPGAKDKQQRVFVFSGGLTSKVAKKYKLYGTLGDGSKPYQKDRSDHRHHAVDAMVISYLRQWARDKNKTMFFKFPTGVDAGYFAEKLREVYPRYITKMRAAIAEQPGAKKIGEDNTPYILRNKKQRAIKEFKNVSKDTDERGQWYENKSESGKGTSQHGYLFYKDDQGKLQAKTVHSFRSPFAALKEVEKKASEILGDQNDPLFYTGKGIRLPSQNKITATQLGRSAWLKFDDYKIVKINTKEIIICTNQVQDERTSESEPAAQYRIPAADLNKIRICNRLRHGESFDLNQFSVDKETRLTGHYRVDNDASNAHKLALVNTTTGEIQSVEIDRKKLINELNETEWCVAPAEADVVIINSVHKNYTTKVKTDDLPKQPIPAGYYLIKSFSGKRVELTSQNGTVYNADVKILEYVKHT